MNIYGVTPGEGDFMSVGAHLQEQIDLIFGPSRTQSVCFGMSAAGSDVLGFAEDSRPSAQLCHIDVSKTLFPFSSRALAFVCGQPDGSLLEAVASALELEKMPSVQETIDNGRGSSVIAQKLSPVLQRSI